MLKLNLLSENLKNENKLNRIYQLVKYFNILLIFFVSFISLMLLTFSFVINKYYESDTTRNVLTGTIKQDSSDITKDSTQFNVISKIQDEFVPWSFLIKEFAMNMEDNITLSIFRVDRNKKQITLTGRALKRENLLDLKKYMERAPYFNNVIFPLKNILEKENIDFEIKADLNTEKITADGLNAIK